MYFEHSNVVSCHRSVECGYCILQTNIPELHVLSVHSSRPGEGHVLDASLQREFRDSDLGDLFCRKEAGRERLGTTISYYISNA